MDTNEVFIISACNGKNGFAFYSENSGGVDLQGAVSKKII
jgi:hypothetical protein